jgi:hypothetical protein
MTETVAYASFLLRLWRDPRPGQSCWQGEIEHIQTRQHFAFDDLDVLVAFLRQQLAQESNRPGQFEEHPT